MKKKICIVTAARAEYGLLRPVINKIMRDGQLEAMVAVTGAPSFPGIWIDCQGDRKRRHCD